MVNTESLNTLDDWLQWMEALSPWEIELGLGRVQSVLRRLDLERPARVIHVAGTNGKGSCVAMLEALFASRGEKTACYTSPHVLRYNERIRVDGQDASDAEIISAFRIVEAARHGTALTYFEFGTLAALVAFAAVEATTVILEIGMGGRLDAVNAVEPDASLITNVSLDHCAWLGTDVESIAAEKAGIMRRSKPVVFGSTNLPVAITEQAASVGADLVLAGQDYTYEASSDAASWSWSGRRIRLHGLRRLAQRGSAQLQNAAAVLALIESMKLDDCLTSARINQAFKALNLPGRCQFVHKDKTWLLDVAHNPASAAALAEMLRSMSFNGPTMAIIGLLDDKDLQGVVDPLCGLVDEWIAVTVHSPRAVAAAVIAKEIANLCGKPCLIADDLRTAMDFADQRAAQDGLLLVTGSFYSVGPALKWLQEIGQQ